MKPAPPDKLTSTGPVIAELEALAARQRTRRRRRYWSPPRRCARMGWAWSLNPLRVNSSQLQNAIRRRDRSRWNLDLASQAALVRMRRSCWPKRSAARNNFAALAIEAAPPLPPVPRMVQILHHVDNDAPIRMLVAGNANSPPRCSPRSISLAGYSGLPTRLTYRRCSKPALEHGGRFLDALLAEDAYREYAKALRAGVDPDRLSDAGRWSTQIPAALAIEQLQGRLSEAVRGQRSGRCVRADLQHPRRAWGAARIPATADRWPGQCRPGRGGVSCGRGSRWNRKSGFQGGDGYLFFGTPELALATLTRFCRAGSGAHRSRCAN